MSNKHLQHVKSNVVNEDEQGNKSPKLPTTSQLLLGEIGINYANGYERMSIKNDANEIVEFVSKEYVVGKNEIDSIVATSVAQAVNPTGGSQTPEQKALTDAIAEAVAKAIQDAIPTGGSSQTPAQEAMTDAISAAVSQAIKDAISSTSPSSEETDLANAISDAVTKAIQDALSASTPSAEQEALTKAISDAVAKAIKDALDPQSQDKTIVEEIDNTITNYVYKNGGTSISLTDVMTNSHTHSNKSVLDNITQEKVTSWDNASSGGVTNVAYDTTNKKITKTVGGKTTDVVSVATLKSDMNITKSDVSLDNVTNDSQVKRTEMGVANGVATLDSAGKVPSSQLPSYVDDVVEGYYYDSKFYKEAAHTTLITGESDKIYVDLSTDTTYRCSNVTNQTYTQIKGDLALGETETTAYRGDRGKIAYDHSQAAHARVDATNTEASSTNGNIKINGTETTVYTHPAFTAQTAAAKKVGMNDEGHVVLGDSLTKSDVGLGDVGNFKAVSTVASQNLTDAEKTAARNNIGAGTSSFSGSYTDLTNKPTIPTVNDAKFSIKGAGTEVASTTANASTASSVDIVAGSNVTVTPDATTNKITIAATDTTYESKSAASGGTDVSLVTTGEKYTWNNKQDAIVFNTAYNASTNKAATMSDVPKIGTTAGTAFDGAAGATAKAETDFLTGSNGKDTAPLTSVANIPVDKRLVRVNLSGDDNFALESLPAAGREIHVIVKASADVTISIPSSTSENFYECLNDSTSMNIASGKYGEINVISDGDKAYIRYLGA